MKQAIVDIEDSRFYDHNGLDVQGTLRALATNIAAGGVAEGGSTLTQQLVKQTLLQTADTPEEAAAADEQTVGRKLREARLALALEETYSKDEILTRYLNIAYFGAGAYGIQAACAAVLLGQRRRPDPAAGLGARRPGAEPDQRRPAGPAGERPGPPGRRPHPDARPGPHHRPGAGRHHRPARGDRGGAATGERVRQRQHRRVLLRLPRGLPHRPPGHDPAADRQRRADHPDHAATGPAGLRRAGHPQHPGDG